MASIINKDGTRNNEVYGDVVGYLRQAIAPMVDCEAAQAAARTAKDAAEEDTRNTRINVMASCARIASKYNVPANMTEVLANEAAKNLNVTDETLKKTIVTLVGQIKTAMHPLVRGKFEDLVTWIREVRKAEAIIKKAVPKGGITPKLPVSEAWAREYHAVAAVMIATRDQLYHFNGASDVEAYAKTFDPDLSPKKVFEKLSQMAIDLHRIVGNWNDKNLAAAYEQIGGITLQHLEDMARLRANAAEKRARAMTEASSTVEPEEDRNEDATMDTGTLASDAAIDFSDLVDNTPAAPEVIATAEPATAPAPRKSKGKGKKAAPMAGALRHAAD